MNFYTLPYQETGIVNDICEDLSGNIVLLKEWKAEVRPGFDSSE